MKLLFKAATDTANTVGQTNFKQHYPFAEGSMKWLELQTPIRQATQLHVIPFIGQAMYTALANDYNSTEELTADKTAIINFLQDAIAHYTIYIAIPYMPFVVSSSGIQKMQPTEGAIAPTHSERKDTRWNAHLDADRYLDEALKLLEDSEGDYWQPWRDHIAKNFKTSTFFKTANELDEYLNIQNSRRAFITLVPFLKKSEESNIESILGPALLEEIKTPDTPIKTALVRKIQKFVAQDALYESVPFLTLVIEGDGFKVVSRGDGIEERNGLKHQQHENAILRLRDAARQNAAQYKQELLEFLWKNKAELPLWLESDYYKSTLTEGVSSSIISTGDGAVFLRF